MEKGIKTIERTIIISLILLSSAIVVFGFNIVAADPGPALPGIPTGLTAVAGYEQVSLSWNAPVSDGGSAIDYYIVHRDTIYTEKWRSSFGAYSPTDENETTWRVGVELPDHTSVLTALVTGLPHLYRSMDFKWTYNFTVIAHNAVGTGPPCDNVSANPYTAPRSVGYIDTTPGNGQVYMIWDMYPFSYWDDGGSVMLDYVIYQDGVDVLHTDLNVKSATITGLTNGHTYNFSIAIRTDWGIGPLSTTMVTPMATIPSAPTGLTAVAGYEQVSLSWKAPVSDGGSAIDYYIVHRDTIYTDKWGSPFGAYPPTDENETTWRVGVELPAHTSVLTALVTGLPHLYKSMDLQWTYNFTIIAHNAVGTGPPCDNVSANPYTAPSSVGFIDITSGNGQVYMMWDLFPSWRWDDGGSVMLDYVIYQDGVDVLHTDFFHNSATITGLTNGHTYNFSIAKRADWGIGPLVSAKAIPMATPDAPTGLSAISGNGHVLLSWTAPANSGESFIDGYKVYQDGVEVTDLGASTFITITGLTNNHTYSFTVAAHNALNNFKEGSQSSSVLATPIPETPSPPTGLTAAPGNGRIDLSWLTPSNNGGAAIDYFVIYQNDIDVKHVSVNSITINGLTNGQSYSFTVAAHNYVGTSVRSSAIQATPYTVPDTPTDLIATPRNGQVSLGWSAPSSNGGAAIDYYVVYQNGTDIAHPTSTSKVITGLLNGVSYRFNVSAHNIAGTGSQSFGVSATPIALTTIPTVPDSPTDLSAIPGNAQVSLSWSSPLIDGGATIDYYLVYVNGVVRSDQYSIVPAIITGLTNGQQYSFTVAAHNSVGIGPQSTAATATPSPLPTVPDAPTGLVATPGNAQVSLLWTTPSINGGAVIDYYLVYVNGVVRSDQYSTTSTTISGLTNDQQYSFAIVAHNSVGASALSSTITATPTEATNVPGAPTGLTATPGNTQITVTWTAPNDNGGSAIDYYIIYQDGIDISHPTTASTNVTSLTNGRAYNFTVAAHNSVGTGNRTSAVTATPNSSAVAPGKPTDLITTAGNGKVTLSWTTPTGSSAIDYYIVYQNGVDVSHLSGTSATITGLTNGENYSFAVAAHNSAGVGAQSTAQTVSPSATGSNNGATASTGTDYAVYLLGILALLAAIVIAALLIARRNRKKV
jgi:hypothetical protein